MAVMILLRFQTLTQLSTIPVQIVLWKPCCAVTFPTGTKDRLLRSQAELPLPLSSRRLYSLILYEKAAHAMPRLETMQSFNHRMITKANLQEPTGHTGGDGGNAVLNRKERTYGCSTLWTQRHLERCAVFLVWEQREALTGKGALMTEVVYLTTILLQRLPAQ